MLWLTQQEDGSYVTPAMNYRIRFEPDPWALPGEHRTDTWIVERRMYGVHYKSAKQVRTLHEAREFIDRDIAGPVFTNDRLSGSDLRACRWCDTYEVDLEDPDRTWHGCNLCEGEIAWRKGLMTYAK